ncbi:hypothetical protein CDAR_184741 [Caerostris darwini]|uniref:Uncharacterized protein n=1 Tax=Caerostris darwini TaxID=1538125 RepID=A0AAV4VWN2_9ARAC|nr:hypothetical protein CDAR_184741 [Caerostris darwini]
MIALNTLLNYIYLSTPTQGGWGKTGCKSFWQGFDIETGSSESLGLIDCSTLLWMDFGRYKIPAEDFLILQDVTWKRSFKSSPPPKGYMRLDVRVGEKKEPFGSFSDLSTPEHLLDSPVVRPSTTSGNANDFLDVT